MIDTDIQVPLNISTGPAFVSGVIEALYAAHARSWGIGDGKTYHNYPIGTDEEAAHAKGQEYTCIRLMSEANQTLESKE